MHPGKFTLNGLTNRSDINKRASAKRSFIWGRFASSSYHSVTSICVVGPDETRLAVT